jgi:phenylacetate-CoA ligase
MKTDLERPGIEFGNSGEVAIVQEEKLKDLMKYVGEHSPYYRSLFSSIGFNPEKFESISQLQEIPFTTKEQFSEHNAEFLCVPTNEVADFVTTSGTLGDPVSYYLTRKDLKRLAHNEALSFKCAGATSDDVFMLMTTMDRRFMAGLAYHLGVQELGAGMVRSGPGVPFLQWDSIHRFNPTYLIAVPSFIPSLLSYAQEHGINPSDTSVKAIVCIGEPVRHKDFQLNELGQRIKQNWDVSLYSTYASTEMATAFTECEHGVGGHHHPDLLHLEVLDDNNQPVASGETGEVVFTTLGVQATPLLRYRSGDVCAVYHEPCRCGRTTSRLGPVLGRKKHMIKYKGTTLFPSLIFDILDQYEEVVEYIVEASTNEFGNDHVRVYLDSDLDHFDFIYKIKEAFKGRLRVTPEISFRSRQELVAMKFPENSRKPMKFNDLRG